VPGFRYQVPAEVFADTWQLTPGALLFRFLVTGVLAATTAKL
jgi:hypothetical protein